MNQERSSTLKRFNVNQAGRGHIPMIFAHGFGCDQNMWRFVAPAFADDHKLILFDYLGHGQSDGSAYDKTRYNSLDSYAEDVLEICRAMDAWGGVFVGHSVSATVGLLAAIREPGRFSKLVLIGPSPCYLNDGDYTGGFSREQLEELLDFLDSNHLGWSSQMAPVIMGAPERPELSVELENSFCRTDPEVAKQFARVTFLSDNRKDLSKVRVPALVVQCEQDVIAPVSVGEYVHKNLQGSRMVTLGTTGHCPHLSAPEETIAAMKDFLAAS